MSERRTEGSPPNGDPLAVDAERMREMAAAVVELLVERTADPRGRTAVTTATAQELAARLEGPAPESGRPFEEALAQLARDVLPFTAAPAIRATSRTSPAIGTCPGRWGTSSPAPSTSTCSSWMESAGPSQLELVVLDWFKEWIGYPAEAAACSCQRRLGGQPDRARVRPRGPGSARCPTARSSTSPTRRTRLSRGRPARSASGPSRCGSCPPTTATGCARTRSRPRWTPTRGRVACRCSCAASAGSTNTGAIDPLPELAAICASRSLAAR